MECWYEGKNNWEECKLQMSAEMARIQSEFSGEQIDRPVNIQPTSMDKAKDALFKEAGEPGFLSNWNWENPVKMQLVTDYFWDHDFPPDNYYWYRGQGADSLEDYRQPVKWLRLSELGGLGAPYVPAEEARNQNPPPDKCYQGALEDFYIVHACYALQMKSQLVRDVFANCEFCSYNKLGMYQLRFYKHSQWVNVSIDDHLPFDKDNQPLCCRGEMFPSYPWISLVEKAYAKLHKSWEAISGGGSVEEVLSDLTGGCSGRFHTTDVAGDRMWKYFQQLGRTTIWACSVNDKECGKRLIPIAKSYASAIYGTLLHDDVPYIGVFTSAPFSAVKHFPMCDVPMADGYNYSNGFMWLRVDDFAQLFDAVYECRLVNSDLNLQESVQRPIAGQEYLPTPGWQRDGTGWYEEIFAYDSDPPGMMMAGNTPSFLFDVAEPGTELILDAGQMCRRFVERDVNPTNFSRHEQAPLLLRFFECSREARFQVEDRAKESTYMATAVAGGEIFMVHMSAWAHTRDAMCCVKVLRPGRYVALITMPSGYRFHRMTFRTYSTKPCGVRLLVPHKNMIAVNPGMPLSAIPWSLTGIPRIDEYREHLPRMFELDEGKGDQTAKPGQEEWMMTVRRMLGGMEDDEPVEASIGTFGGPGGGNSTSAIEHKSRRPCEFM